MLQVGPLSFVHVPVPELIVFPASVVVTAPHKLWSVPAVGVVGLSKTVIDTSSYTGVHAPLEIVQRKT